MTICDRSPLLPGGRMVCCFKAWGLIFGMILSLCISAGAVDMQFSSGVASEQSEVLTQDLSFLYSLDIKDESGELRRVLRLEESSSRELEKWLDDRIQFIIDAEHPLTEKEIEIVKVNQHYSSRGSIVSTKSSHNLSTLMTNIGALLYRSGKETLSLLALHLDGIGLIEIKSPRVGIVQLGKNFFKKWATSKNSEHPNLINSVYRMTVLYHEARHSDGRNQSLGFVHSKCPDGHLYAGYSACDLSANGPYRIGALLADAVIEACTDCTQGDIDAIKIIRNDSLLRVMGAGVYLDSDKKELDPTLKKLCSIDSIAGTRSPFCPVPIQKKELFWDDTPESIL